MSGLTDTQLRDAAVAKLKQTTVGYINKNWTIPPAGTNWEQALDLLGQIGAVTPPPDPPVTGLKGIYSGAGASQVWNGPTGIAATCGCDMIIGGADDNASLSTLKAAEGKMWGKAGYWNDATGQFSMTDAQALAVAQNIAKNYPDVVVGWYVADEPTNSAANRATIQKRAALLKSGFAAETVIGYYDAGSLSQWKGIVDAFALDIYPSKFNWNMALITQLAAAADKAGLRYYGVPGAFAASGYQTPTNAQLQQMIDLWKATKQSGIVYYAWDPGGSPQLKSNAGWQSVIKAA